ncbi:hypothetical protein F5J12DRAFT_396235 [Pisolithus orientalis]|uniref:uncharacterized protein n=1 Tax=Pisolithus orientalis TaxID=936130 RepID=UPI0022255D91|nr:uncharacterized protein F5J12DRAFT_396235 [Pisolithus orientalis]KAI6028813.1 hypothetical protein F5J12DRAFT_396235 [Pisolithus orientalis]
MAAIYAVYTSPTHPPVPNHLPTLVVTPHGQPSNILYSYLHTNFNAENYLLTPSPQGDLCVARLFPPRQHQGKSTASDPGHSGHSSTRVVRCEASRNLKWSIANTGVISPIYKLSLPSPDSPDLPLFQISKPNPNAAFWSMFYFAYAGHNIPPRRIEFGKIQKNPPGPSGGGTRISITGKTPEEKAVWQTLGEGNEDCVEWVVLCAALNLLDDEIMKAAEKNPQPPSIPAQMPAQGGRSAPVALHDPGPQSAQGQQRQGPQQQQPPSRGPMPGGRPMQGPPPPRGFAQGQGPPPPSGPGGYTVPPQGYAPGPGRQPPPGQRPGMSGAPGAMPPLGMVAGRHPPPQGHPQQMPILQPGQPQGGQRKI